MISCNHSPILFQQCIWMTFSFTARLRHNTCSIFNRFCTPYDNTSYTPTWKNDPSAWTGSITWATSLIIMVYMWLQTPNSWHTFVLSIGSRERNFLLGLPNIILLYSKTYEWSDLTFYILFLLSPFSNGWVESCLLYQCQVSNHRVKKQYNHP